MSYINSESSPSGVLVVVPVQIPVHAVAASSVSAIMQMQQMQPGEYRGI